MKLRYLFFTLFIITCTISAQVSNELRERIYLQTDKDNYMAGELVWTKLITTTPAGQPLSLSKIGYVELLDEKSTQVQLKIELANGVGNGNLVLPTTLPTGYYRLIAYTRYMRNENPIPFFEKNISVINPLVKSENNSTSEDETIAQVRRTEQNSITITNQRSYRTRDAVEINLNQLPQNIHTLSISIAGKDFETNTPNIKYWRNNLRNTGKLADKYLPEYEGHIITGKLIDNTGATATDDASLVTYVSFPGKTVRLFAGKAQQDGKISFFTQDINDVNEIISTVYGSSSDNYRVDIESPFILKHQERRLPYLDMSTINKEELEQRSIAMQILYSYMNDSLNQFKVNIPYFHYRPDNTYVMEEYTKFATMQEVITEFITFVRFRRIAGKRYLSLFRADIGYSSGTTLVLLDGIPIFDHEIIFKYNPLNLERTEVYFDRFIFGGQRYEGLIHFKTINGNYPDLKPDEPTKFFSYEGTKRQRLFYSPIYESEADKQSRLPDFRHTLYWNSNVNTDNKESITIPFYTSDYKGNYQITVEGITKDGNAIYATSEFKVE